MLFVGIVCFVGVFLSDLLLDVLFLRHVPLLSLQLALGLLYQRVNSKESRSDLLLLLY